MRRLPALLLSATTLAAAVLPARADPAADQPAPLAQAESQDDSQIVVTARRRRETVQEVPIAISTVDARTLEATGSFNVNRLTQLLPSVQFFQSNPRNANINIRGLGAPFGLTNDGIEQGVGLYIDQVYFSRPAAASFDFNDAERIEVLRGPQGTLYGKNTTAGAINITSRRPTFTPEGRLEVTGGNLDFVQLRGSLSGPLVGDKLAARASVAFTDRRGVLFNTRTGQFVNELNNLGLRGSLLWQPHDGLDITLQGDWNRQDPRCCTQVYARVVPTLRPANRQFEALARQFNYQPPSRNAFDRLTDVDSPLAANQSFGGASLLIERRYDQLTFTSVTAFRYWDWNPANDRDFIGLPITTESANFSNQRQYTQEFRLASDGKGRFDFVAGVFAYRQEIDTFSKQAQGAAAAQWLLAPGPNTFPALLDGYRQDIEVRFNNNSLAAFGQLTWRVTDTLRIEPGVRINYDDKYADFNGTVAGGLPNPTPAQRALQLSQLAPQAYIAKFSDTNFSGDVKLSWEPGRDVLLYAQYARAFKTGGINLGGLPFDAAGNVALSLATIRPETVDHYEVGVKSQLFDRALTANLSLFQTDIADYQTTVVNGQVGVLRGFLANAEQVRIRGAELETNARIGERVTLYATTTLLEGKYVRFPDAPAPLELTGGPQVVDASGQDLPGVSRWAVAFGGEYRLPVGSRGRQLYVGVDGSYRSSFSSNPTPSPFLHVDGYSIVNFRAGYLWNDRFELFGWVRNALDTNYFEFLSVQPGNSGLVVGQVGDPRTYGVTLRAGF